MKILCVDDEITARRLYEVGLRKILRDDDELFICASGEETMNVAMNEPLDLMIADLSLQDISGLEILKRVKGFAPQTEVIIVTGKGSVESAVESMHNGARDYLEKPINIPLLGEKLVRMREFYETRKESDELYEAKTVTEEQADHEVHLLEEQLQQANNREACAREKVGNLLDRCQQPHPPSYAVITKELQKLQTLYMSTPESST